MHIKHHITVMHEGSWVVCQLRCTASSLSFPQKLWGKCKTIMGAWLWSWLWSWLWCCEPRVVRTSEDKWKERLHWFHTTIWMLLWQVTGMTSPPSFEHDIPVSNFLHESIEAKSRKMWWIVWQIAAETRKMTSQKRSYSSVKQLYSTLKSS